MSDWTVRPVEAADEEAVTALISTAFGGDGEARLVAALRRNGDVVLELVAEQDGVPVGYILFSRLWVEAQASRRPAVALAPLAVLPAFQKRGVGSALVAEGHARLSASGEALSVVLGSPGFYGRFDYSHARAAGFESAYQCEALQALAWAETAPRVGRLVYAPAFAAL